ncbi:MAG: hypothetical protein K2K25_02235, partial [Muribaculaceae bacterium]|nr:hypothetical protein [Muribaculaceae bacterium]
NSKASYFLHSYLSLQEAFLPMQIENGVILKDVSVSQSGEGFNYREMLNFTFEDSEGILTQRYGSNIGEYIKRIIPGNYPFWLEIVAKCTDGVSFQIDQVGKSGKEVLLYTSEEIREMLSQ